MDFEVIEARFFCKSALLRQRQVLLVAAACQVLLRQRQVLRVAAEYTVGRQVE